MLAYVASIHLNHSLADLWGKWLCSLVMVHEPNPASKSMVISTLHLGGIAVGGAQGRHGRTWY